MTEATAETRLRILSLDDDSGNQSLIGAILSRATEPDLCRAELIQASTIAQARALLAVRGVDIVLLDVQLPDGLGLDLANELRSEGVRRPAVLALTASVLPADQQAAIDAGCDAFLAKPFAASQLIRTLQRLTRERNERIAGAASA